MYDPIFAKSFTRNDQRRFFNCAVILFLFMSLNLCMIFKPHFHPLSAIGNAMNLNSSIDAAQDVLELAGNVTSMLLSSDASQEHRFSLPLVGNTTNLQLSVNAAQDMSIIKEANTSPPLASEVKEMEPICRVFEALSDYCEMTGDIRIQGNSSTIFIVLSPQANSSSLIGNNKSWTIQPYPRKGNAGAMDNVRKWTVKLVADGEDNIDIPECRTKHTVPAVLFSTGGYRGNHFHDFADLIIPIYSTSQQFNGEVKFLATDYASWWISKFKVIVSKLSNHDVIDIDKEKEIHCFPSMIAGLKCHKELDIDSSKFPNDLSMNNFRQFLRKTYSLDRSKAIRVKKGDGKKPRMMIISRSKTRLLMNEGEVIQMAKRLGYQVMVAEANVSSNLTRFAQEVNSCDVLMGIHGAGLTNMVFLPDNAILIQIVPLGGIEKYARNDFGKPSNDMNIRYLEYKIKVSESSLIQQYPVDHPVFRDPFSYHRKGWMEMRKVYLDNQNVKIDLHRFRSTLVKALRILRHRS